MFTRTPLSSSASPSLAVLEHTALSCTLAADDTTLVLGYQNGIAITSLLSRSGATAVTTAGGEAKLVDTNRNPATFVHWLGNSNTALITSSTTRQRGQVSVLSGANFNINTTLSLSSAALQTQLAAGADYTFAITPGAFARCVGGGGQQLSNSTAVAFGDCLALFDCNAAMSAGSSSSSNSVVKPLLESRVAMRTPGLARLTCGTFHTASTICVAASGGLEIALFDVRTGGFPTAAAVRGGGGSVARNGGSSASAGASRQQGQQQLPAVARGLSSSVGSGPAVAIAAHPLDSNIIAVAQRSGVVALFDLRTALSSSSSSSVSFAEPLSLAHASAQPLQLFWHHSPADLLSVVTTAGVEAVRFGPENEELQSNLSQMLLFPLVDAACFTWTRSPRIIGCDSSGKLHSFGVDDTALDAMAPNEMPRCFDDAEQEALALQMQRPSPFAAAIATARQSNQRRRHEQQEKPQQQQSGSKTEAADGFHDSFAKALRLAYRRQVNDSATISLTLLSQMLVSREKHSQHSAADAATQQRIDDIIALSVASSASDNSSSPTTTNSSGASTASPSSPPLIERLCNMRNITARLVELSLVPPSQLTRIVTSASNNSISGASVFSSLPPAAQTFLRTLVPSPAVESRLAALSVHLTIANFAAQNDGPRIAGHRELLARVIRDGAISPHLTQRVLRILLNDFTTIGDAAWILEQSLLAPPSMRAASSPQQQQQSGGAATLQQKATGSKVKDDVDGLDAAAAGFLHDADDDDGDSEDGSSSSSGGSGDEDDDDNENRHKKHKQGSKQQQHEKQNASPSSPMSPKSAAAAQVLRTDHDNTDFWALHPMLSEGDNTQKIVFAILEALFFPLACDTDGDDAGIAEFFESGGLALSSPQQRQQQDGDNNNASSASGAVVLRRDRRSARDCRRLLKLFIRDCAQSQDSKLFARTVRMVLRLRTMEQQWRHVAKQQRQGVVMSTTARNPPPGHRRSVSASGNLASAIPSLSGRPAEQCAQLFVEFEDQCRGYGLSLVPSRFVLSRFMHAMRACHKDAAALWMAAQLGDVLGSKQCSRPLAQWMADYAENLVNDLCDLADVAIDAAERIAEVSSNIAAATPQILHMHEREVTKTATEMHRKLGRLVATMYECENIYSSIPKPPGSTTSKGASSGGAGGGGGEKQLDSRAFMGDALDRIGDAAIDALGQWNQLLQIAKLNASGGSAAKIAVCECLKKPVEEFGQRMQRLIKALGGEASVDETMSTLLNTVDDFLGLDEDESN